jgi:hypothetical protein
MSKIVKRGYAPNDEREFNQESMKILHGAGNDLRYLLNRGYDIKGASTFVGNHYQLSERQRLALVRAVSSDDHIQKRKEKELKSFLPESTVHIDGFNTIITLEVALSGTILLKAQDGTIRDLAGLRGTYRLIDKTDTAITWILSRLEQENVAKAVFYLDSPVSNSGRLKQRILELSKAFSLEVQAEVIHNVDTVLSSLDHVITADAIILDKCRSWSNLNRRILEEALGGYPYADFEEL